MSGILIAVLASLLAPQTAPHPSTLESYTAPVIRPFEPGSDFGREVAEGDAPAAAYRPALAAPVTVDAYRGAYEFAPSDVEIAYDQGVASAEERADQTAGPLDGFWRMTDADGRTLHDLVLMDSGVGPVEGGWRNRDGAGGAVSDRRTLTLEGGGVVVELERAGTGWRGRLTVNGQSRAVTLTRPD